jgi:DNA helicase-2/ATP-dependent DNA helicase PcrA
MAFNPTDEQRRIIEHPVGLSARILAGPGTGKSATLLALVNRITGDRESVRLRLLTFTRAATAELQGKMSPQETAVVGHPSTIHSFAISVLLRNPGTGGFPEPLRIADDWEMKFLVRITLRDSSGFSLDEIKALFRELAANWESLQPSENPDISPEIRARFLAAWQTHRRIYGYTLLAELPYSLNRALINHENLEGLDYDCLMVDEYQDLNACDLNVLRLLENRGISLIAVGDDDQSIYSFRKAAPEGIRRFPNDYPESRDYSLSKSLRCGANILNWANYVIAGDLSRSTERRLLQPLPDAEPGEAALLAFAGHVAEANGIAEIVFNLTQREGIPPSEILVLVRTDRNRFFSGPIKERIEDRGVACSDPSLVTQILENPENRKLIALLRLACYRNDSLAWLSLLELEQGIGNRFFSYIYDQAVSTTAVFSVKMLELFESGFPEGPQPSSNRVSALINSVSSTLDGFTVPEQEPNDGWGAWISQLIQESGFPTPSEDFVDLLGELDQINQVEIELSRFLSQIEPLGRDIASAKSDGVRIMTMTSSKGLTVRAAIIACVEDGIIPRPVADLSEERRILYVAMTRAREHLFCTWARRRRGPTARSGQATMDRRNHTTFFDGGPVGSRDGVQFIENRW